MAQQNNSYLDRLSPEELLRFVQRFLDRREIEVRRCVGSGLGWMTGSVFLLGLGGVLLYHFAALALMALLGSGVILLGLAVLVRGLVWVTDRAPVLILGAEALVDRRKDCRIPWAVIRRATLHRTTRNGFEDGATLVLGLSEPVGGRFEVALDLADLDHDSGQLLRVVGQRANLS